MSGRGGRHGTPIVSVVIPTRDRCELLATTLATVLAQGVDLEVVVVDDGSSDDTPAMLAALGDDRVRIVRHGRPTGVSVARNDGVAAARAPRIAFTDDDDPWAPDKLVAQLAALDADPDAGWSCSGAVVIDGHRRLIGERLADLPRDVSDALLAQNVIPGGASGVVADAALVRRVGGFDPALSVLADWDVWTRLALESPLAAVRRPLHAYRIHAQGMSTTALDVHRELDVVDAKHAGVRRARGVVLNRPAMELWMGDRSQRGGRRLDAARSYLRSFPSLSRPRQLAKSAEAVVWPGMTRVRDRVHGRRLSSAVRAEVEPWLTAAGLAGPPATPAPA